MQFSCNSISSSFYSNMTLCKTWAVTIETIIALYFKEWSIILRSRFCLFLKANHCPLVCCSVLLNFHSWTSIKESAIKTHQLVTLSCINTVLYVLHIKAVTTETGRSQTGAIFCVLTIRQHVELQCFVNIVKSLSRLWARDFVKLQHLLCVFLLHLL